MTTETLLARDIATPVKLGGVIYPPITRAEVSPPVARKFVVGGYVLNLPRVVWMLIDAALACGGTVLGHEMFVWWEAHTQSFAGYHEFVAGSVLATSVILAGSMFGLYDATTLWARSRIIARCLLTVTVAMAATWLIMHLFMYSPLSRRAAATGIGFYLLVASILRLVAHYAVRDVRRGLLVIGQGPLTGAIIRSVRRGSVPGYRLVGIVGGDRSRGTELGASDIPVVGDIGDIENLCRRFEVAEVVVAGTAVQDPAHLRAALTCLRLGCRVTDETTFFESTYGEVPVSHITPTWFLAADLKGHRREHAFAKRAFDTAAAAMGLLICAPLFAATALAILIREGRPVFYSQERVGKSGRIFTLYKFRTMRRDAEANGSAWASANDPRITRMGWWLRKLRIDELPQLWNILKGDMSVVGPRPERPEFVGPLAALIPFYDERHLIKPGLTGWAQINLPYGASVSDARRKLQLDLYYIKHISLELDIIILLRTFGTFCLGSR